MGASCTIGVYCKNTKGEVVESKLFNDCLHYTDNDRSLSKEYYGIGTSEEWLSHARESSDFRTDENGQITLNALRKIANWDLDTDNLLKVLNRDIGEGEYSYDVALRKIQDFSASVEFEDKAMATMSYVGKGKYHVSVVAKNRTVPNSNGKNVKTDSTLSEQKKLYDTVRSAEVEKEIISILERHGVSAKFLDDSRPGSRYSTEDVSKTENGLWGLIEVSNKGNVTDLLAEEAGHFAVGALGDNPLVKRMETLLKDAAAREQALGSEEYREAQLGDNPARETAGRLVGKALQRKISGKAKHPLYVLANRVANLAKRIFYNIKGDELKWGIAKAEQVANKIAYGFANGSSKFTVENALSYQETMHNAALSFNQQVYRDVADSLGRAVTQLQAICKDDLEGKLEASFGEMALAAHDFASGQSVLQMNGDVFADQLAFDGIVQALVQISEYLGPGKELDSLLSSVDTTKADFYANMSRYGRNLRQARVFLTNATNAVKAIDMAMQSQGKNSLKNPYGTTLDNVRYQDINGIWHTIDMRKTLNDCLLILVHSESALTCKESEYFARFCEDAYGKNYITASTGKLWKDIWFGQQERPEELSIEELVTGSSGNVVDIDLFHRYLSSMSNNPDIIGQIVNHVVKVATGLADKHTWEYQDRLLLLNKRRKDLGLDMRDLFEKDENGVPTGNIILPPPLVETDVDMVNAYIDDDPDFADNPYAVNYGEWEKAREENKRYWWEEFKKANPNIASWSGFTKGFKWDEYYHAKYKEWNKENSVKVVYTDPSTKETVKVVWMPNKKYKTDAWDNLERKYKSKKNANDSISLWVRDYMQIKQELDSLLPEGATVSRRLPQFRGTFSDALRNSANFSNMGVVQKAKNAAKKFMRRDVLEKFVATSQDTDYGDLNTMNHPDDDMLGTALDYEKERPNRLVIFGVRKIENLEDLSTDLMHSTLAYASMATTYDALSNLVDALEVGKSVLYNRKVKPNKITKINGVMVNWWKSSSSNEMYNKGEKNMAYGRYLKFLDKQVYGIGTTQLAFATAKKRWMLGKIINTVSSLGGALYLAGNPLGGMVNTFTGFNNDLKEAIAGDAFTLKDWVKANKWYFENLPRLWMYAGELRKNDQLSLFLEVMSFQGNAKGKFRSWHTTRSRMNNIIRNLNFLPYSSGDHYMQAIPYLALANGTKLYNEDGTEAKNLWDAYQRVRNNDDEVLNGRSLSAGYTLQFDRMCPVSSSEITIDSLNNKGFYLKKVGKSRTDFEEWLYFNFPEYLDRVYTLNHVDEKMALRDTFNNLPLEDRQKYAADRFAWLRWLLMVAETGMNFTVEERNWLNAHNLNVTTSEDALQVIRDQIYNAIWTENDKICYMNKARDICDNLHGIYNDANKTAFHQNWFTNAFLCMKGWALGNIEWMFSNNHASISRGKYVEGFSNTALKMVATIIGDLRSHRKESLSLMLAMACPFTPNANKAMQRAGFSEEQYFNVRRFNASMLLILLLWALKAGLAPDDDDDDDPTTGAFYYLVMRGLLEQQAFFTPGELYQNIGQLGTLAPVGFSAAMDLYNLAYEGIGAVVADKEDSKFFYQSDSPTGRFEEGDTKFEYHLKRLIPYYKNVWAIEHPYEAAENYEFGRKLRTR